MEPKPKQKRSNASFQNSSTSTKLMKTVPYTSNETPRSLESRESYELFIKDVYETADEPLEKSVRQALQTRQGRETLHSKLGPLGRKYVSTLLGGDKKRDRSFYIYLSNNGTMFDNNRFDIDTDDFMM